MAVVFVVGIRGTCYYDLLAENGTTNSVSCLELFKKLINQQHCNQKHAAWLPDNNAKPHRHATITPGIS